MENLSHFLGQLQQDFHRKKYLSSDPLEFVHRYDNPWDQEAVALLSAVLAYGKVAQIRKSISEALSRMSQVSKSPSEFVRNLQNNLYCKNAHLVFDGYVHRFNLGSDLVLLFELLNKSWSKYGSLGGHFVRHLEPQAEDIGNALSSLIADWRKWLGKKATPTFSYLLTSPADGSCCKRWCMLLRWMGRKDALDLGLWTQSRYKIRAGHSNHKIFEAYSRTFPKIPCLKASQLVMPLDTHTGRISQYLGLTDKKSLNWKAALQVTNSLKKVDPADPTRYDFALSRLGILDICQRSYRQEICQKCQLLPVCQLALKSIPPPLSGLSLPMPSSV